MEQKQILLTNDDGIQSPGLWAAAGALSELGYVHVVAPRQQYSGAGRSMLTSSDGRITIETVRVNGKDWTVYAVGGTPAQAVLHGVLEILPRRPDLVVSGINYGENVGSGVTISGTVGAALEGAAMKIPSIAVSLQTEVGKHLSYSTDVDFSPAAYFAAYFARLRLEHRLPPDVHVLKVDIPKDATRETPWRVTRLSMHRYFEAVPPDRQEWGQPAKVSYRLADDHLQEPENTDIHTISVRRMVSVTPLSLDLTSRVDLAELEVKLRG